MIRNLIESNPATTALLGTLLTITVAIIVSLISTIKTSNRKINTGGGKYIEKDDNSINVTRH